MPARRNRCLLEGMRAGDLRDVMLPLLSVDEFESKIDPSAVVFAFYVHDKEAAADLNSFVQKCPFDAILDTEVSPAPDQRGYYRVFVEFLNNARLPSNIEAVLQEVAMIADITHWQMRVRKTAGLIEFSADALRAALARAQRADRAAQHRRAERRRYATVESAVFAALRASDLTTADVSGRQLTIGSPRQTEVFEVLGVGRAETLLRAHALSAAPLRLDLATVARCERLARLLGEGWQVDGYADVLLLSERTAGTALLVRPPPTGGISREPRARSGE